MLEYLRRDAGRRAGFTSSPDFLRNSGGFIRNPSSSASLSSEDVVMTGQVSRGSTLCLESKISLDERECAILRASAESDRAAVISCGAFVGGVVDAFRSGDDTLFTLMCCSASSRSFKLPTLRPRSSSSDESGGVVIAPDGIRESFTGGGDGRMLPLVFAEPRLRRTSVGESIMLPSTGVPLLRVV